MRTEIRFTANNAVLEVTLDTGESVRAEPGAMLAQRGVEMRTGAAGGGLGRGLRRILGGESFFVNTFTGKRAGASVLLAPPGPGDIEGFDIGPGESLYLSGGAFLACTGPVELDAKFQGAKSLFSGEGAFFLRAHCAHARGTVFYAAYGAIMPMTVEPHEDLIVDNGHVVAFTEGVAYSVGKVGGIGSLLAAGEGLVLKFRGTGTVWVQTRNLEALAGQLAERIGAAK